MTIDDLDWKENVDGSRLARLDNHGNVIIDFGNHPYRFCLSRDYDGPFGDEAIHVAETAEECLAVFNLQR